MQEEHPLHPLEQFDEQPLAQVPLQEEHNEEQAVAQPLLQEEPQDEQPVHPLQPPVQPVQVFPQEALHNPVQFPLQDDVLPVNDSASHFDNVVFIVALSKSSVIGCSAFTFRKSPISFIFNNKSIVFCPCSALIKPPDVGVVVKLYDVPA